MCDACVNLCVYVCRFDAKQNNECVEFFSPFRSIIQVSETDKLPKIVCSQCLTQVETIVKFRETCVNAQSMLESCLNSTKLRNGGKVCIRIYIPFHHLFCFYIRFLVACLLFPFLFFFFFYFSVLVVVAFLFLLLYLFFCFPFSVHSFSW